MRKIRMINRIGKYSIREKSASWYIVNALDWAFEGLCLGGILAGIYACVLLFISMPV